ncbi:hypothetical protein ACFXTH_027953 [Malus domestica]
METIGANIIEEEKTCNNGSSSDRISGLPADIQHHILSFLPIKFVARTSVLSRRWSSLWASFPILDFYSINPLKSRKMNFEFISSLLQRRDQNSKIKVFRVQGHLSCSCLHDCIDWVVWHNIEKLTLEISLGDKFDLPSCVFNCDSVRSLNLMGNSPTISNSQFRFPSSYVGAMSGMCSLRSLRLIFMEIWESARYDPNSLTP